MTDNTITVVGNITRDPELRFLNSGSPTVRFAIAVNRRWKNSATSEWEERVSYFEVTGYGSMAENAANSLAKGNRVVVSGRLEQRSWMTDGGERRSTIEINADEIAPSLRFATAVVTRTPRAEPGEARFPGARPSPQPVSGAVRVYNELDFDSDPF